MNNYLPVDACCDDVGTPNCCRERIKESLHESKNLKYEYGVGSRVWTLKAPDLDIAMKAMAVHLNIPIPIVIYHPVKKVFTMKQVLIESDFENPELLKKIRKAIDSVEEVP